MSRGRSRAHARGSVPFLSLLFLAACSGGGGGGESSAPTGPPATLAWTPNLAATTVAARTVGATQTSSSTRLQLSWSAPSNFTPSTYEVTVSELAAGVAWTASVTGTAHSLTELKSDTAYRIDVRACHATCYAQPMGTATAQTPAEVWHLQGSGNGIAGLERPVADGNVRIHAMRIGEGAPAELVGHLRLYYGPFGVRGYTVATSTMAASEAVASSYLSFASRAGTAGLNDPSSAAPLVRTVATGQGVALSAALGAKVRLFFEALGDDGRTRILYVDSQDGYSGLDFNANAGTVCSTAADYSAGGGCAPTVAIGVEGDATAGWPKVVNARQFKIGVPTATDWRWDGAAGTFMVFTLDSVPGCSPSNRNQAYAVWSGTAWDVQYEANGCPRLMTSMQAAHPVHLGAMRYKLYYGDPSITAGRNTASMLPFLGPKKLLYADGALTGPASRVDFEDWETPARGREIRYLWPDGSELDAASEGYIDDFTFLAPTGSPHLQVMYLAITDGSVPPFAASAVLVNP